MMGVEKEAATDHLKKDENSSNADDSEEENFYPVRPDKFVCLVYLRTGFCAYGPLCLFNHPKDRMEALKEEGILEDTTKVPVECKFYLSPGGCKYGGACKYGHYRERSEIGPMEYYHEEKYMPYYSEKSGVRQMENYHEQRNMSYYYERSDTGQTEYYPQKFDIGKADYREILMQLPSFESFCENMVEKICPFYLSHGCCRYQPLYCMFLHPDACTPVAALASLSRYQNVESLVHPESGTSKKTKSSGNSLKTSDMLTNLSVTSQPSSVSATHFHPKRPNQEVKIEEYPLRSVKSDHPNTLRTATSTDGHMSQQRKIEERTVKHDRPRTSIIAASAGNIGPTGLPLRPGKPICVYYRQFGLCKYGRTCKYDHPVGGPWFNILQSAFQPNNLSLIGSTVVM